MTRAGLGRLLRHLPIALRGRPLHGGERHRPFFIVGSGRCGSTLLRAMLEAHPEVHIPPENSLGAVVRDYRHYSRLPWNAVLRIILGHFEFRLRWEVFGLTLGPLFRELEALPPEARTLATVLDRLYRTHAGHYKPSAVRWGDKTPGNAYALAALRAVFPDLRVVHIVRDGRDVVRSWMFSTREALPLAAGRWLQAVRAAQAFGARYPAAYHEVRYEDLVHHTGPAMHAVASFLDLGFDERMLRHHELDLPLDDVERLPFLRPVRGPIHAGAIGRWRAAFDGAQLAELDRLLGPTLAALGYEVGPVRGT